MTATLRIVLVVLSIATGAWIVSYIRKAKLKIEDSVFWLFFALFLIIISIFPEIIDFGARIMGIQSSQNFLFLAIIFILIVKIFRMSIKMSQLESKLQTLAQNVALDRHDKEK